MQQHEVTELLGNYNAEDKYKFQFQKVHNAWQQEPGTMKEIEVRTGVDRANICRYVSTLRKARLIAALGKRECKITKRTATEFTTNPALFPTVIQPLLFDEL